MTEESSNQQPSLSEDKNEVKLLPKQLLHMISNVPSSQKLLSKVGYCILLFSLFDFLSIFYPPQFTNPFWELGFIQETLDRVIVPIIGFALVFMGSAIKEHKYERWLVKGISWLTLLLFLSCIPLSALTLSCAVRIDRQNSQQLAIQKGQSLQEIQLIQQELSSINSAAELTRFLNRLQSENQPIEVDAAQYADLKEEIDDSLSQQSSSIEDSNSNDRKEQRKALLKQTLRILIGLFISGAAFFCIWRETKWVRKAPVS